MVDKPLDRRVVRTRQMLREALISLILERGYDNLTINDITTRADLRRATFYLHYDDKEDLLLATLEATFDDLVRQLEPASNGDMLGGKSKVSTFLVTFEHVAENSRLYRAILGGQAGAAITRRIRAYLARHIIRELPHPASAELLVPAEVLANYIAGAEVALIQWWLESDMPYSAREMAGMAQQMLLYGAQGCVKPAHFRE
jgi:AcrR family transcriptional regulator